MVSNSDAVLAAKIWGGKRERSQRRRVRIGAERRPLHGFLAAHCRQFPTVDRVLAHVLRDPLPAEHCDCEMCYGKIQGWPVGYKWMNTGQSYECGLHQQSKFFLENLPSSTSIVRFK